MTSNTQTPVQLLLTYLKPQAGRVALLVLAGITLQLSNPLVMRTFLDGTQNNRPFNELSKIALLFIALALLRQLFQFASTWLGEIDVWAATNALCADLAMHCLKLDMGFHKVNKPGELIGRVDGDINQLVKFFSQLIIRLSANLVLCIGVLSLLRVVNWAFGLTISLVMVIALIILSPLPPSW